MQFVLDLDLDFCLGGGRKIINKPLQCVVERGEREGEGVVVVVSLEPSYVYTYIHTVSVYCYI